MTSGSQARLEKGCGIVDMCLGGWHLQSFSNGEGGFVDGETGKAATRQRDGSDQTPTLGCVTPLDSSRVVSSPSR